jgi:hypothetical protein
VRKLALLLTLLLFCAIASKAQNPRGPSTPEKRKRAVMMATFLETTPLAKEAKDYRVALLAFFADVPDITIELCTAILGSSKQMKGDYEGELFGQLAFSQGKFIIENPDKAQDRAAVFVASVEGVLRTWNAIKSAKPKAKFPLMDELLEKQKAGTLADYVKTNMAECK